MRRGFLIGSNNNQKPDPTAPKFQALANPECRYATPPAAPQSSTEFKCTILPPPPPLSADQGPGPGPYSLCLFHGPRQEAAILSTPNFPSPVPAIALPRYHFPGGRHTKGMTASRRIDQGALIVAERPLFLIPATAFAVPLPAGTCAPEMQMQLQMRQYNMILERCLARLPERDREAFYMFETHGRGEGLGPILERIERNALGVVVESEGGEGFVNAAIFRDVSRIRHRCSPNATWDFDVASFSMQVRARWPIEEGEEIFISYVDDESVIGQARRTVLEKYGVSCGCALCS